MTNDGGPAFPSEQGEDKRGYWNQTYQPGMSLRDWFAGQALVGLCVDQDRMHEAGKQGVEVVSVWAETAYLLADAMLAQRSKP